LLFVEFIMLMRKNRENRGLPSATISSHATAEQVRTALLQIPKLTDVTVTFSQPYAHVCQLQANIVQIEFTQQFGPQPPLVPLTDSVLVQSGGFIDIDAG
jgi:hypothetical protein